MNRNDKIYIAGSLFNEAEGNQRKAEERALRQVLGFKNIYNPINAPCNDKSKLPTAADVFNGDTNEILESDIVVADISNPCDLGVACELGIIWACNAIQELGKCLTKEEILEVFKPKKLITHLSDIRKGTAGEYNGNNIPVGFNQYMIGLVEDCGGIIKDNFEDVVIELAEQLINDDTY